MHDRRVDVGGSGQGVGGSVVSGWEGKESLNMVVLLSVKKKLNMTL